MLSLSFLKDLESIIDHDNPSNHCSSQKYSREERKKEDEGEDCTKGGHRPMVPQIHSTIN